MPFSHFPATRITPAPININSNTGNAARLIHTEEAFYQASERRQNAAFLSRKTRRLCLINKRFERENNKVMPSAAIEKKPRSSEHPKHITSATGAILWQWQGDPFGNSQPSQAAISPTISNAQIGATAQGYTYNQRFAGQTYDKETGLYYNDFRHYDPATGRYVEADPIGLEGGWNRYAYVGGNPLGAVDPTGEAAEHTKNARPSTLIKHQKGMARKTQDRGREAGDSRRPQSPRIRPPGHKGPWPPKQGYIAPGFLGACVRSIFPIFLLTAPGNLGEEKTGRCAEMDFFWDNPDVCNPQ